MEVNEYSEKDDDSLYKKALEKGKKLAAFTTIVSTIVLSGFGSVGIPEVKAEEFYYNVEFLEYQHEKPLSQSMSEFIFEISELYYEGREFETMEEVPEDFIDEFYELYEENKEVFDEFGDDVSRRYSYDGLRDYIYESIGELHKKEIFDYGDHNPNVNLVDEDFEKPVQVILKNISNDVPRKYATYTEEDLVEDNNMVKETFMDLMDPEIYEAFEESFIWSEERTQFTTTPIASFWEDVELSKVKGVVTHLLEAGNEYEDYERFREDNEYLIEKMDVSEYFEESELSEEGMPESWSYESIFDGVFALDFNYEDFMEVSRFLEDNLGHRLIVEKLFGDDVREVEIDYFDEEIKEAAESMDIEELAESDEWWGLRYDWEKDQYAFSEVNGEYRVNLPLDDWIRSGVSSKIELEKAAKHTYNFTAKVFRLFKELDIESEEAEETLDELKEERQNIEREIGSSFLFEMKHSFMIDRVREDLFEDMSDSEFEEIYEVFRWGYLY